MLDVRGEGEYAMLYADPLSCLLGLPEGGRGGGIMQGGNHLCKRGKKCTGNKGGRGDCAIWGMA